MQGNWSLYRWLLNDLPSVLSPSSQRWEFTTLSNSYLQNSQFLSIVNSFCCDSEPKPRIKDFGGAWKAALQSAVAFIPWQLCGGTCRRDIAYDKAKFHETNYRRPCQHTGFQNSFKEPFASVHSLIAFLLLEHLIVQGQSLCVPAGFPLTSAVLPPHENLPSELLPSQLAKAQDATFEKVSFLGENDDSVDISGISKHMHSLQDNIVVEPKTGFQFPAVLYPDPIFVQSVEPGMQVLAGVGLKSLTIMKLKSIKIYAFALYIRPDALKAQLSEKYATVSSEELKQDPRFYSDILSRDLGMTVRMMVHYKAVKMGTVKSAFDKSLRNRLRKIKGTEDDEGLKAFNAYFSQNFSLPRGTVIDFRWLPGGQLRTEIDGQLLGTIHSRDFCRAFFDLYVGDPPVSSKAREELAETLSQILQTN